MRLCLWTGSGEKIRSRIEVRAVRREAERRSIHRALEVPADVNVSTSMLGGSRAVAIWISRRRRTSSRIADSRPTSDGA